MKALFHPDETKLGRCNNCNSIFWIKDTVSGHREEHPSGVYCSSQCADIEFCNLPTRNRLPNPNMIKVLVRHEDEWAKRGLIVLGKSLLKGGAFHGALSLELTIDIINLYDAVKLNGWTEGLLKDTKRTLPKYSGHLFDLAYAKRASKVTKRRPTE